MATRNNVITVVWLLITAILPFVHLKFGKEIIDPFINCSMPMETNSFVYALCGEFEWITFSVFAYRIAIREWKWVVVVWIVYCVYDLIMFIWCYNHVYYYYIPYAILLWITWKLYRK